MRTKHREGWCPMSTKDLARRITDDLVKAWSSPVLISRAVWTTRERVRIPVTEMEDSHLANAIAMLEGRSIIGTVYRCSVDVRAKWIKIMRQEAFRRHLALPPQRDGDPR